MKRKVIKQGNGTLTITLPKNWTREVGLTGDDEVELDEIGDTLVVKSKSSEKGNRINIELESDNIIYIRQILRNLYLSGYDEMYILFYDLNVIAKIRKEVDDLIGCQILEQSNQSCLIKNLSPVVGEEFSILVRRLFLLNKNMFDLLIEDLSNNQMNNKESIMEISKTINRLGDYCRRTITKKLMFNDYKSTRMYLLITRLITISNSIEYIYKGLKQEKGIRISSECIKFVKKAKDYFELFYKLYYEKKTKNIYKISVIKDELLNQDLPRLISANNKNNIVIHYVAQIIRDISRNGGLLFTLKQEK